MKLTKKYLRTLIRESITEMHSELNEASGLKKFEVSYKTKSGKDSKITIKARDKDETMAAARQKLKGKFYDLYFAKELDEMTTTADVMGYDAPMSLKKLVDDEDDDINEALKPADDSNFMPKLKDTVLITTGPYMNFKGIVTKVARPVKNDMGLVTVQPFGTRIVTKVEVEDLAWHPNKKMWIEV